jgi:hypothetical protein
VINAEHIKRNPDKPGSPECYFVKQTKPEFSHRCYCAIAGAVAAQSDNVPL